MTQSNLLELAKDGNPQAIATLMNFVLEPKGVTAKVTLKENCLHIFFTSEQLLSKATIASFVQSGLKTLGARSFGKVKLYAQKVGQSTPIWVDEWVIDSTFSPSSNPVNPAISTPQINSLPAIQPQLPLHPTSVTAALPAQKRNKRPLSQSTKRPISPAIKYQAQQKRRLWHHPVWERFGTSRRSKIALSVGVGAFLIGGGVAAMLHSQASSNSQVPALRPSAEIAGASNQLSLPTNPQPANTTEAQAEKYLVQMNKAQQAFYQSNQRFAATLEELERSASIISHSSHYSYRLVIRDQTQSVLTATPKSKDLRSYAGTVLLAQNSTRSESAIGIICKTNQASTFPPVLSQPTGATVQCPVDSASLAY
ncbi:MAG: type IV pilin-like G/H family protein [Oscillatoriales cyanobacterium C42_A2020_001]|nr:type IV pilin-like G/H family protein [Leptolyngbyaceae cyanobacterium C42_A2020_001]